MDEHGDAAAGGGEEAGSFDGGGGQSGGGDGSALDGGINVGAGAALEGRVSGSGDSLCLCGRWPVTKVEGFEKFGWCASCLLFGFQPRAGTLWLVEPYVPHDGRAWKESKETEKLSHVQGNFWKRADQVKFKRIVLQDKNTRTRYCPDMEPHTQAVLLKDPIDANARPDWFKRDGEAFNLLPDRGPINLCLSDMEVNSTCRLWQVTSNCRELLLIDPGHKPRTFCLSNRAVRHGKADRPFHAHLHFDRHCNSCGRHPPK